MILIVITILKIYLKLHVDYLFHQQL